MNARLPALRPKDVFRALTHEGFYLHHATGSHYFLKHPAKSGVRVTLPIERAGYTTDEFAKLL